METGYVETTTWYKSMWMVLFEKIDPAMREHHIWRERLISLLCYTVKGKGIINA
jgi:hypothetical protein